MSSSTPRGFQDPTWTALDALGWIADRDPEGFGRVVVADETRASDGRENGAEFSTDRNPKRTLLHALQQNFLCAIKDDGAELKSEFWSEKHTLDVSDLCFRRADVLAVWPIQPVPLLGVVTRRAFGEAMDGQRLGEYWTGIMCGDRVGVSYAKVISEIEGAFRGTEAQMSKCWTDNNAADVISTLERPEYSSHENMPVWVNALQQIEADGQHADTALRRTNRRKFGVSSKNQNRLTNMLITASPYMRRELKEFNADQLMVATLTHTLRFVQQYDPDCPDPKEKRVLDAVVKVMLGHDRAHFLTCVVPVNYNPKALAPKWSAFLARFMPDEATRRTLQQFTGLGMTGLSVQRFMFHHGTGANGKSVFLEVITRLLGPSMAIGLPVESIMGNANKSGSQASPDMVRLFGKRMVRVVELPSTLPLSIDVVKKLTGGELIPVRTLFKGMFEFQPVAKPHFSANGQPLIDDTSNGIWRRMFPVEWPVTLAEAEQRDFDDVVRDLLTEAPGILN